MGQEMSEFVNCMVPFKRNIEDFPGGLVVKDLPAKAGDAGSIPGPGRSYMLWGD